MLPRKTAYNTNLMSFRYKVFNVLIKKFMFIRTIIAVIVVIGLSVCSLCKKGKKFK